jgi:hypothetical protein
MTRHRPNPRRILPAAATALLLPFLAFAPTSGQPGDARESSKATSAATAPESTAPATGRSGRDDDGGDGPPRGGRREGRWPRGERQNPGPPTEEEWREAAASMQALAPNAWARFLDIPEHEPFRRVYQRRIVDRFQELERLKERNRDQYDGEVEQLRIEDDIFGIAARLREAEGDAAERLKADLRERVERLIDLRISNREMRIARLSKQLDNERRKLEGDKANKPQAVQKKYDWILSRAGGGLFGNPGGRGGPRRQGQQRQSQRESPPPPAAQEPAPESSGDAAADGQPAAPRQPK